MIKPARAEPELLEGHRPQDLEGPQGGEKHVQKMFPKLKSSKYPDMAEELKFLHAEEILEMYPDLPRKQRRRRSCRSTRGIHHGRRLDLNDGYPHEMRPPTTTTGSPRPSRADGKTMHGINRDILVWNPVTRRRHE